MEIIHNLVDYRRKLKFFKVQFLHRFSPGEMIVTIIIASKKMMLLKRVVFAEQFLNDNLRSIKYNYYYIENYYNNVCNCIISNDFQNISTCMNVKFNIKRKYVLYIITVTRFMPS